MMDGAKLAICEVWYGSYSTPLVIVTVRIVTLVKLRRMYKYYA